MGQKEIDAKRTLKNKELLGTSISNASMHLLRSIIFDNLVSHQNSCYRCGEPMSRYNFSIDHKIDWRKAENARELFFSTENIAYSHILCNSNAAKRGGWNAGRITHGISGYRLGCRCDICRENYSVVRKERYQRLKK